MSESVAGYTADPSLISVNGKEVKLYPLTVGDTKEFSRWLRAEFLTPALDSARLLPPEERAEFQRVALGEAKAIDFFSSAAIPLMWTTAGKLQALWLSFRNAPKSLTPEEVRALFTREDGVLDDTILYQAVWSVYCLSKYCSAKRLLEIRGLLAKENEKPGEAAAPK